MESPHPPNPQPPRLEGESSPSPISKTEPVSSSASSSITSLFPNLAISSPKKETQPRRSARNTKQLDYHAIHHGSKGQTRKVVTSDAPIAQLLPPRDSRSPALVSSASKDVSTDASSLPHSPIPSTSTSESLPPPSSQPQQSSLSAIQHLSDDPRSLEEVMSRPDWPKWKEAMDAERTYVPRPMVCASSRPSVMHCGGHD